MDVSYWTWPSYWKAGVYLQDDGEATAHFDDLFEEDGSPQNYFPSVSITDPSSGSNFLPGSDITITADAVDSDGTITKVEFFEGGTNKLGESTTAPYSFTWTNAAEGNYTLTAKATDNEGGAKTSLSTLITVMIPIDVTGVELTDLGPIAVGANIQLAADIMPANATNKNMVFESDDPSIATVTESGLFTAVSEGEVNITVTTDEGGFTDSKMIKVLTPSSEFNWALNKPISGTGIPDGNNVEENLVDDSTGTRWSVNEFPQSATVDLLGDIKIVGTEVTCYEDRAYQFIIEGAANINGPFTTLVDRSNNIIPGTDATPIMNCIDSLEARYVRITVTGADVYTGQWVSLTELRVFGEGEQMYSSVNDIEQDKMLLSPNPATSFVTIEGSEDYDTVTVFDQAGRRILLRKINNSGTLDIQELQSGIYMVKLEGNDKAHVCKLVKL